MTLQCDCDDMKNCLIRNAGEPLGDIMRQRTGNSGSKKKAQPVTLASIRSSFSSDSDTDSEYSTPDRHVESLFSYDRATQRPSGNYGTKFQEQIPTIDESQASVPRSLFHGSPTKPTNARPELQFQDVEMQSLSPTTKTRERRGLSQLATFELDGKLSFKSPTHDIVQELTPKTIQAEMQHHDHVLAKVRQKLSSGVILLDIPEYNVDRIVSYMVDALRDERGLTQAQRDEAYDSVIEREMEFPIALEHSFDLLLGHVSFLPLKRSNSFFIFGRLAHSVNLAALDGRPIKFVVLILGRAEQTQKHIEYGHALSELLLDNKFHNEAFLAKRKSDVLVAFDHHVERMHGEGRVKETGLISSGSFAGGVKDDVERRLPAYKSDFTDAWHPKCISSVLYIFFATLAPSIAFGGLLDKLTDQHIGVIEMILSSAISGILFALFSGQPLIIIGGTGPIVVFIGLLYEFAKDLSIPFFGFYCWVGIWTGIFTIILAISNASVFIRQFTEFTDEIFSTLISLIFISEGIKSIVHGFDNADADAGMLSLILTTGTFYIANLLRTVRSSRFLRPGMREFLSDFGLPLAMIIMTAIDQGAGDIATEKLDVPDTITPTYPPYVAMKRDWVLDPMADGEMQVWAIFLAILPALLLTILIFLEQNITSRIVNRAENNLEKGPGYHLDLLVVGILTFLTSFFGLPWVVAAVVRSLSHVNSLATVEEYTNARGQVVEHVVYVRENRLTGVLIHCLLGCTLALLPLLQQVPTAILFGVFLYMGIASLTGSNQLWERTMLLVTDPALYPPTHYARIVPLPVIHTYTIIQLIALGVLWGVKSSPAALLFPLLLLILPQVREYLLKRYDPIHIATLESSESEANEGLFADFTAGDAS